MLRGRKLLIVKRLVEKRRRRGKGLRTSDPKRERTPTLDGLLRSYRQDTDKKRMLVKKAEQTRDRLIFVTEAPRTLLADEHFVTLLRAEGLSTLPRNIANRLQTAQRT